MAVTPGGSVKTLAERQVATWEQGFRAIAVDASGTVYAVIGHEIRKIGADGHTSILAGNATAGAEPRLVDGTGTEARFRGPFGMAVAPDGALFVTDAGWVRKVTPQGKVKTLSTCKDGRTPGMGDGCLGWPVSITVDEDGRIYTASDDYAIRRITPQGQVTVMAHGDSGGSGLFQRVGGLTVDPTDGSVLVTDSLGLHKISPDGSLHSLVEDTTLGAITTAIDGTIYAVQSQKSIVTIGPR